MLFKIRRVQNLKLVEKGRTTVKNSVRNLAVPRNWRQNTLRNCRCAGVKNVKKTTTRINILTILPKAYEAQLT